MKRTDLPATSSGEHLVEMVRYCNFHHTCRTGGHETAKAATELRVPLAGCNQGSSLPAMAVAHDTAARAANQGAVTRVHTLWPAVKE
jgi:hypothetical protein